MEQQSKIGGLSLSNRGVANKDRISELPEALLLQILSLLPTIYAITTSVLSKRWKSLWKLLPNLKFDSGHHYYTFSEDVCRSLISHKAPFLESLHLEVGYECDDLEMGSLLGIAFARHVRKLVLDFVLEERGSVKFPAVLCSCNNTLEILELKGSILLDLPSGVCFKSLRKMYLYHVRFRDEESVLHLLCDCPRLEDLIVYRFSRADVANFVIAVPSLQRLTIEDDNYGERVGGYLINAPSLKYLNINGFYGLGFCLIKNAPELVEAIITNVFDIKNENILETLTPAKRLSLALSPLHIKYPTGKVFYQLLSLELYTTEEEWCNLLSLMLDSSPKLQILKLRDPYYSPNKDCPSGWEWNQPKCAPECLLFHLETFEWKGYRWQLEDEKEVATYILKNARRLKKATLSTKPIKSKELEMLEKRREMLNELANVVRASSSCHLVCEADTYSSKY
ncbi:PREDICTED: FBD-associated F-box protein At3g49020-like isoform X2 [Camelina sativa]|uniref:FBD-associated F-box protein At3g49020-like isoform X1 n=1 Tax=Camelina sativa TaxID=90675 RepID=A0ABM0TH96_CAMSA|nr:PREDICTED: FBD-associated F-box protein At3g49020-like isoform X1 [Camelina sativa]XP_019084814.1 PREDICTED: FBD-associated F-box protein At3g49020-like isoform X2 [Camelina sativa]